MNSATMSVETVARSMPTLELIRVIRALNDDLEAAIAGGVQLTQAHVGMLEMLEAAVRELDRRECWPALAEKSTPLGRFSLS